MSSDEWDDDLDDREFPDPDEDDDEDDSNATIPCPYCRRPIYEDAVRCPYCEQYLSKEETFMHHLRKPIWIIVGTIMALAGFFVYMMADIGVE